MSEARLRELDSVTLNLEGEKVLTPKLLTRWLCERRSFAKKMMELETELVLVLEENYGPSV